MKIRLLLSLFMAFAIPLEAANQVLESRLNDLRKRVRVEVDAFVSCVKGKKECSAQRKRVYAAIGALLLIVGATAAGRMVKSYQKSQRRQDPVILSDAPEEPVLPSASSTAAKQTPGYTGDYPGLYPADTSGTSVPSFGSPYSAYSAFGAEEPPMPTVNIDEGERRLWEVLVNKYKAFTKAMTE